VSFLIVQIIENVASNQFLAQFEVHDTFGQFCVVKIGMEPTETGRNLHSSSPGRFLLLLRKNFKGRTVPKLVGAAAASWEVEHKLYTLYWSVYFNIDFYCSNYGYRCRIQIKLCGLLI